tara:strand:- start:396 stop:1220 length:825 start_codon:yes stop_codon:yes gene_type:complete
MKILKNLKPHMSFRATQQLSAGDIIFNWTPIEIPTRGAVELKSISYMVKGTNAATGNGGLNFRLLFAKSIDNQPPTSLGTSNVNPTTIDAVAVRPYLIGSCFINASETEDSNDPLDTYNFGSTGGFSSVTADTTVDHHLHMFSPLMLQGDKTIGGQYTYDDAFSATREGHQTIFVAGINTEGGMDFGTGVLLNQASNQATSTTSVGLVTDGVDADDIFAVGDVIKAGGNAGGVIGTVTGVAANLIAVDRVDTAFDDDEEIYFKSPIQFNFGFEY